MKKLKIILCIIVVLSLIISYFFYISYYHIDVTSYTIDSSKINDEVHIVMISDVHDHHCRVKNEIINKIKVLKPDVILCVGDIIDDQSKSDKETLSFLKKLTDITTVYMSLGNHEMDFYKGHEEDLNKIKRLNVHLLEEQYEDITVNNQRLRIGGMYNYAFSQDDGKITKKSMHNNETYQFLADMTNTEYFQLMMAHRPDSFIYGEAYKWDIDLICSGHVHGGQVILPFIGGLYAPEQGWFPKCDFGLFKLDQAQLLVTRGISSSDEYFPRFNNPCEIVDITLK